MSDNTDIEFYIGQVVPLEAEHQTYKPGDQLGRQNKLFCISVLVYESSQETLIKNVQPISANIKQIPIIGESVLIVKGYNNDTTRTTRSHQWYYFPSIGTISNANHNYQSIPVNSSTFIEDPNFLKTEIVPKQPFRGDFLIEGRWGNSIRLGSSVKTNEEEYTIASTWNSNKDGDPIIILTNTRSKPPTGKPIEIYSIENIESDDASLYLTSTQNVKRLKFGTKKKPNSLKTMLPNESEFKQSQFIGVADRIVLSAKTDLAVINSPRGIILNTTGEVKIGNDSATSNLVHGDILYKILQQILNQLRVPIQCGTMLGGFTSYSGATTAQKQLKDLLSSKYFITKSPYK
jgi:hypothetical protein